MSDADATRMREAFRMVAEVGDEIWPGFSEIPFPVLLVTADREFLVGWQEAAPEGFEDLGLDDRLGRTTLSRPQTFSPRMEASFPAFGAPAVVVFGTAEATGRISNEWVLTVLHEHMHQLQYAAPGYYSEVDELNLSNTDPSGMWMLNYPFPYDDEAIGRKFTELAATLREALESESDATVPLKALREFLDRLEPADARYFSFQLWQEGIGRYVELRAAEIAASGFVSSDDFSALPDSVEWDEAARTERARMMRDLESVSLADNGRVSFYAIGAALGVLFDRSTPGWKSRYLTEKFALDAYGTDGPAD